MKPKLLVALATTVAAMVWDLAQAADAPLHLEVDSAAVLAPVNPAVLRGHNFGLWMQVVEFQDSLRALRPSSLRFPGGNVGDEFDLDEDRLKRLKPNLDLLGGPGVWLHTRVFQSPPGRPPARNRPEDAAAAVRIAREQGLVVQGWEVGNEPDLFAVTRGDPSWTAERYCEVFRAQAQAIKQADPQARVAGPAVSGAVPVRDDFMATFIKGCGDVVDLLTYHLYPTDGSAGEAEALQTVSQADEVIQRYRALWASPRTNPKGHQRAVQFGVTEYGLSWRTDNARLLADFPAAMWAAEVALRLNRHGVDMAHYFALQGTGNHGVIDNAGVPRPTYYAFRLLAGLEGRWVAARSGDPDVWAHAVLHGDQLRVLLINKSRAARRVAPELPGWQFAGGERFDEKIVDAELPLTALAADAAAVELPGYSFTQLVFQRR